MLSYVVLCCVMLWHVCYGRLFIYACMHVMLCYVMLCYVMLCYVMVCYGMYVMVGYLCMHACNVM